SILRDVQAFLSQVTDDPDEYVQVVSCSHWAYGWVEHLAVRVLRDDSEETTETLFDGNPIKPSNITAVFSVVADIAIGLREDYSVYDESDYYELESEEDWERFTDEWNAMCLYWDAEDDGPEPTDDEMDSVHRALTEQETPEGYWHEELKTELHKIRG